MNCRLSLVSRELNIWTCHLELRYSHIKLVHVLSSSFKFDVGNHLQIILWLENRCKRFKRNVIHMTNILWRRKVDLATQLKNNEGIRVTCWLPFRFVRSSAFWFLFLLTFQAGLKRSLQTCPTSQPTIELFDAHLVTVTRDFHTYARINLELVTNFDKSVTFQSESFFARW